MTFKNVINKIPDLLMAQLAGFSIVYGLTTSLCLPYKPLNILLFIVLILSMLFIFFFNKKTTIAACVFLCLGFSAAVLYTFSKINITDAAAFFENYFTWLDTYMQYPDIYEPSFGMLTVFSLCILISIFSYIFTIKKFNFFVIAGAGIALFTVQSTYKLVASMLPFYIFLPLTLMFYIKYINLRKASKISNEFAGSGSLAFFALPVCILIIATAALFHINEKPIEWKWMDQKINSIYNYFKDRFDYEVFDYFSLSANSGFGRRNQLGGRVKLDKNKVLQVDTVKNVYLKGVTRDIYLGNKWISSSEEKNLFYDSPNSPLFSDTNEMLLGMKLLTGDENFLVDYFYANRVTVTFMNIKTKSIFMPSKATSFLPERGGFKGLISSLGDLSSSERMEKGFMYYVDLYTPKMGSKEFADALKKSKRGFYQDSLINITHPSLPSTDSTDKITIDAENKKITILSSYQDIASINKLMDNSDYIYKKYLQLPQELPQRVRDLSATIVTSCNNDYDKAKAIETYLSTRYPYNLDVRPAPRNRDFVDYFLFDLKEGYCSYYATAMAVLARCAGLPARYVEGYILPPESDSLSETRSSYIITNMQAHAWVEIYFEGYGWLPFEPTSPFGATFYSNEDSNAVFAESYSSDYDDYMEMMRRYEGNEKSGYDDIEGTGVEYEKTEQNLMLPAVVLLFIVLIVLIGINTVKSRFKLYKMVNLPAKKCILAFYEYYISVLGLQKLGLKPAETPSQYGSRIDNIMFFNPVKFKTISWIFVRARYSTQDAGEKEKQMFVEFRPVFLREVRSNMGKFNYFIQKYILGKF